MENKHYKRQDDTSFHQSRHLYFLDSSHTNKGVGTGGQGVMPPRFPTSDFGPQKWRWKFVFIFFIRSFCHYSCSFGSKYAPNWAFTQDG